MCVLSSISLQSVLALQLCRGRLQPLPLCFDMLYQSRELYEKKKSCTLMEKACGLSYITRSWFLACGAFSAPQANCRVVLLYWREQPISPKTIYMDTQVRGKHKWFDFLVSWPFNLWPPTLVAARVWSCVSQHGWIIEGIMWFYCSREASRWAQFQLKQQDWESGHVAPPPHTWERISVQISGGGEECLASWKGNLLT